MKLAQLIYESVARMQVGKQIHEFLGAPIYWADFDEDQILVAINRGDGKITSVKNTEYRMEGNIVVGEEHYGTVTIGVGEDQLTVTRLINIELLRGKKKNGIGTKVVTLLTNCTSDGELIINDIKKSARPFWNKLGAEYFKDEGRNDMVSAKIKLG